LAQRKIRKLKDYKTGRIPFDRQTKIVNNSKLYVPYVGRLLGNISIGCWQDQIYETHNVNNEEVNEETVENIEEYHAKGTLQKQI
jgi:hypothetical protein